jgi:hypothetical protein
MADKPWKRVEREKCRELGGERSGPTGTDTPDCTGIRVGLEIKYVKKYTFLTTYWEQAVENAAKAGLPPVLAIKEAKRGGRDCIQMFTRDYYAMIGHTSPWEEKFTDPTLRMSWGHFVRAYRTAYDPAYQPT